MITPDIVLAASATPVGPATLAFWTPGPLEIVVILVIALLLFGRRLPEVGRSLGKGIVEFKKGVQGIEDDLRTGMNQGGQSSQGGSGSAGNSGGSTSNDAAAANPPAALGEGGESAYSAPTDAEGRDQRVSRADKID